MLADLYWDQFFKAQTVQYQKMTPSELKDIIHKYLIGKQTAESENNTIRKKTKRRQSGKWCFVVHLARERL